MISLKDSEIELMKGYILGKKVYDRVFPEFYDLIAHQVEKVLQPQYPLFEPAVGPRDRIRAMTKLPDLGERVPLDWVAFGFSGLDLYDFHVGVILLMEDWPVKYHIGLHIMDPVWPLVQKEVELIDWKKGMGLDPTYVFESAVREHRYLDPVRKLRFNDLDGEINHISDRVIRFYRISAPVAAHRADRRR